MSTGARITRGFVGADLPETEQTVQTAALQSAIFNSADFSCIATDAKGVIQIFNVGAERMLGYTSAEVVNRITPADISDPDELIARAEAMSIEFSTTITPGFEALVFKASRGIEDIYELTKVRKDGSLFPAVVSVTALRDTQNAIIGYLLIATDNSVRKEAEEALRKAAALQNAIFNSADFSCIATDAKGVIQIFNVGAERMLGYTSAEVVNRITPADISDPDELIARAEAMSIEFSTTITPGFEALIFKASRGIEDIYELTKVRKDGSLFPAVVSVTALRDAQNAIIGYLLIATDNSVRKEAEEALRKAGSLQSAIFNSADFSCIATDAKGVIQIFNIGAERMLGYTSAEVVNRITPADISDPDELIARAEAMSIEFSTTITPGFEALIFKASRGIEDIYELTKVRKDGSLFPAVVSVTALRDAQNAIIGYLLIATDNSVRKEAEEALRKAGSLQSAIFNNTNFSCIATDAKGVIQIFNVGAERMLGYTSAEVVNRITPADISDPDELIARAEAMSIEFSTTITPGFEALIFKASRGIEDIYELTKVRKDGSLFPAMVSVTALRDAQNAIIGYLLIGTDNTARKESEALRRDRETAETAFLGSEERFATLIRSIMDGIISVDVNQNIVLFNPAARRMFGYSGAEMLGLPIAKLMPRLPGGEDHEELLELSEDEGVYRGGEAIGKRADGMEFPVETSVSRTLIGGEKIITVIVRDITERKKAEAALLERESLLRIAGNIAHFGGMIVVFPEQKITCSEEIFSILDLAPGTVITLEELLNFPVLEWRDTIRQAYADCIRDGIPFDVEIEIVTGTGYRKWVRVIGHPRRGVAGNVVEINGAFQDISDRKKMEQQFLRAQRMESVGTLASGIAHDLNNVLTPVMMAVELLRMNITGRDDLELLDTIAVNTQRGAEMVNQVLSFGRGVEGRRVVVQVRDLIKEIEKIARDSFPKDIEMRTAVPADLWTIVGDPTQLHQVLLNLGVNARDAMPRGGILTITAENIVLDAHYVAADLDAREGPYVLMRIEDTGIGIPGEIIEKIFDPFFTTKAIGQGTGLGLSTSIAIVKSHGGFMHVYSEPGKGTQFQVYLPAGTQQPDQPLGEKVALIRGNGETILVVDDEPSIRKMARRILEIFGYQVIEAADGIEALGLYSDHRNTIAVVIMDMMMPKMGGLTTIQALIKENPDVRIIAASGIPASGAEARATAPGAVKQFLHKPYTTELLLTAVHQALGADS